jgi:hypothetical protein
LVSFASKLYTAALSAAAAAVAITGAASAADLTPNFYGAPSYLAFTWAGPYVGAFFVTMPAQLLARLCPFNTSRQSIDK